MILYQYYVIQIIKENDMLSRIIILIFNILAGLLFSIWFFDSEQSYLFFTGWFTCSIVLFVFDILQYRRDKKLQVLISRNINDIQNIIGLKK